MINIPNIYKCKKCTENKKNIKSIHNEDKNLEFEILCNEDYRFILNKIPILNNYTTLPINSNISYRYCCLGHTIDEIKNVVDSIKKDNYYEYLKNLDTWKCSYECNLIEGKD